MTSTTVQQTLALGQVDEGTRLSHRSPIRTSRKKWVRPSRRSSPAPAEDRWVVQCRSDFLDGRVNTHKKTHLWMLLILESFAKLESFCYPGSQLLAEIYGCTRRQLQTLLKEMEEAGLIIRVMGDNEEDSERIGFILCLRSDPNLPVADSPELVAQAREDLARRRATSYMPKLFKDSSQPAEGGAENFRGGRCFLPGGALKTAPPMRQVLRDKHSEKTTTSSSSFSIESGSKAFAVPTILPEPVEPEIAQAVAQLDHATDRSKVLDAAPDLTAQFGCAMVLRVILELNAKRRAGQSISHVGKWAAGVLKNWQADGKVSNRLAAGEVRKLESEARRSADAERQRKIDAEKFAKRERERIELEAAERWKSLPEEEKQPLRAEFERDNPPPNERTQKGFWTARRENWCYLKLSGITLSDQPFDNRKEVRAEA